MKSSLLFALILWLEKLLNIIFIRQNKVGDTFLNSLLKAWDDFYLTGLFFMHLLWF
jgi:hypothetical protein